MHNVQGLIHNVQGLKHNVPCLLQYDVCHKKKLIICIMFTIFSMLIAPDPTLLYHPRENLFDPNWASKAS